MPSPSRPLAGHVIAFDLDGTLVDTAPDLVGTLNLILTESGLPTLSIEAARPMIGRGARALIERGFAAAGERIAEDRMAALFNDFIDLYLARIADESRPFPGAVEALDRLSAQGARLCICTNKRTGLSMALLNALGLAGRFAAVVGPDAAGVSKPDPRHIIAAIEAAGGAAERAVMVGDSISDVTAAKAAGVPVVAVSFGYTEIAPADLGADILIDRFDDLDVAVERLLAPGAGAISPVLPGPADA